MAEFVDITSDQGMVHPEYHRESEPVSKASKKASTVVQESPVDCIVDAIFHDAFLTYCSNNRQPKWVVKKLEALTEAEMRGDGKPTLEVYRR